MQLANRLRTEILAGRYMPGEALPSVRDLSAELGVAKNTVQAAYRVLAGENFVKTQPLVGSVVVGREDVNSARLSLLANHVRLFTSSLEGLGFSISEIDAALTRWRDF